METQQPPQPPQPPEPEPQPEAEQETLTPGASSSSASASRPTRGCCGRWVRPLCSCADVLGGLAAYTLALYLLVALTRRYPTIGLPLLAVLPPLLLLALCGARHSSSGQLSGWQLALTAGCAVLWMSPLLLLQWLLATTHVPTILFGALDSECAECIDEAGGPAGRYVGICQCWGKTFVQSLVISALPEEALKLVAVLGVANRTHISRPSALVIYAMAAAAGFAAVENSTPHTAIRTPSGSRSRSRSPPVGHIFQSQGMSLTECDCCTWLQCCTSSQPCRAVALSVARVIIALPSRNRCMCKGR